jgi:hypothetical protein
MIIITSTMKRLLATASLLLLIGAGCSAQTSGSVDTQLPNPQVDVNAGGEASY